MDRADSLLQRCFVGVWPQQAAATRLERLALDLGRATPGARPVPRARLHLTLAFIGDLDSARARELAQRLLDLPVTPFAWIIDRIGHFAAARVAWASGPAPAGLQSLVQAVHGVLEASGVRFDRRPYVPHVTLLRDLPRAGGGPTGAIDPPIPWQVGAPRLLHSAGGRYLEVAGSP